MKTFKIIGLAILLVLGGFGVDSLIGKAVEYNHRKIKNSGDGGVFLTVTSDAVIAAKSQMCGMFITVETKHGRREYWFDKIYFFYGDKRLTPQQAVEILKKHTSFYEYSDYSGKVVRVQMY